MHSLLTLIAQILVILLAARGVGWLFRRAHQPQVVGEMVAGILLGPSLLGWLAPGVFAALFPPESLGNISTLSLIGLLLFMFLVGLEFDPRLLRGRREAALITSHVSIIAPFFLGALLALYLYPRLSDRGVSFTGFALFMGAAMSVTAFPVLARILTERNLLSTRLGALTIACAAVDDVTAWSILAVVVAIVRSSDLHQPLWVTLSGSLAYVVLMVFVVRRALGWLRTFYRNRGRLTQDVTAAVLLLLLLSAWTTEWLGIHALFGAFLMGAVIPKDPLLIRDLRERLEDVTVLLLLPLFFAFTGLRTSIGLVSGGEMWLYFGLVLMVAVVGKFGGSAIAARATALSWREAGALGILMNTRGLMELVILSIGLDLGVISPALFTMMVLMALVTTFMTAPVLELFYPARLIRREAIGVAAVTQDHVVVIPISLPSSGPGLLQAARTLAPRGNPQRIYALYLERAGERPLTELRQPPGLRREALGPVLDAAQESGVEVRPLTYYSRDVARDIVEVAHAKQADMVLMGWHKPVLGRSILSGTVHDVMEQARVDVAVYVERGTFPWRRVLVPYSQGPHDRGALELARRIAHGTGAETTILHVVEPAQGRPPRPRWEGEGDRIRLKVVESDEPLEAVVTEARDGYDLLVLGVSPTWGLEPQAFDRRHQRLAHETGASLLMVRRYLAPDEDPDVDDVASPAGRIGSPASVAETARLPES